MAYTLRARLSGWYFHENRTVHMRSILCCVFVKLSRQLGDPRRFDFLKALKTLSQVKQGRSSRIRQQSCGPRLACTSTRFATEHSAPFFRSDKTLKRKRFHSLTTARQYAAAQAHLGGLYLRPHCAYERTCAGTASGPSDCPLSVPCCPLSTLFKRIAKTSTDCLAFSFGGRVVQCHIPQKQPSCVEFFQASEWRWPTRYAPDCLAGIFMRIGRCICAVFCAAYL